MMSDAVVDTPHSLVLAAAETKDKYLWKAKLAQEANRYEDMAEYMRLVAETGAPMTKDEDNMLAVAYKRVLDAKRSSRRTLTSVEQKDGIASWEAAVARDYRVHVDDEQRTLCNEVLSVINGWRQAGRAADTDPATGVFYLKLTADYKRYAAEATDDPDARAAVVAESRAAYEQADTLGRRVLRPIDPVRLGLMLNYSVFLYQVCNQRQQGHDLAKRAFDEAVAEIDSIEDYMYEDSTLILRLIRDNLTIWIQENNGASSFDESADVFDDDDTAEVFDDSATAAVDALVATTEELEQQPAALPERLSDHHENS